MTITDFETRNEIYVDGVWTAPASDTRVDVIDPSLEERIGTVVLGSAADIDRAVEAATAALPGWSSRSAKDRVAYCTEIGRRLLERSDEFGDLVTREVGMPRKLSGAIQVGLAVSDFSSMEGVLDQTPLEHDVGNSVVLERPIGVVGAITPWNYPLHQIAAKLAPALAAGCTVVLKPSEIAVLSALRLVDVLEDVGLPSGVVNVVPGRGVDVGAALAAHRGLDMVTFTGSTGAGAQVAESAGRSLTRVALELGGKSPSLLLDDLDDRELERAVRDGVAKCFLNSGQTCAALTRLVVPAARLQEVEDIASDAASTFTPGDPFDAATRLGPVVSEPQRRRVRNYIDTALREGARLVHGGSDSPPGLERGWFVKPTVLSDVAPDSTVAQEEVFGPVLSLQAYDTVESGIALANQTRYGLAAAVWASDLNRAHEVARQIRSGQVQINDGPFNPVAPFGGFGDSGYGRECGVHGLREFLAPQSLQLPKGST